MTTDPRYTIMLAVAEALAGADDHPEIRGVRAFQRIAGDPVDGQIDGNAIAIAAVEAVTFCADLLREITVHPDQLMTYFLLRHEVDALDEVDL